MRIFLNSCGYSRQDPAHEYRWKSLSGDPAIDAIEELNRKRFFGLSLSDLVESDSRMPSLVLARDNGDLVLLVTRIPSLNRLGSQGDTIFSSVLFVGKNFNLLSFRRIAANLLSSIAPQANDFVSTTGVTLPVNLLQSVLDANISFHNELGFSFAPDIDLYAELEAAADEMFTTMPVQQNGFRWLPATGHNCSKLRQELAYELAQFTLPQGDGPIAVVTGYKSPFFARKAEAWRSLGLLTEGISWQPIDMDKRILRRHDRQEAIAGGYASPTRSLLSLGGAIGSAIGLGEKVEKV